MKNYDELTNDLLERRDRYIAEQRHKRNVVMHIVTSVGCACVVMLIGIGVWNSDILKLESIDMTPNDTIADALYPGIEDVVDDKKDEWGVTSSDAPIDIIFVVNRADSKLSGAMPDFAIISDYCDIKNLEEINEYLGYDVTKLTAVMPDGFRFAGNYEVEFYYKNDGTLVHDHCYLGYANGEQWITIGVSKIGAPYDCLYMMDNPTPTVINSVEIVIGAYYTDENSNDYDVVFADFSCNGMYYRVTLSNMPTSGENDGITCMINILSELTK